MQVTEISSAGLKREFKVVIAAKDIEGQVAERLEKLATTMRLPGFRPGKVPTSLVRKRFGAAVLGEVVEQVVSNSTSDAIRERNLRPALQPKVEVASYSEGQDLEYTVALEILPEIEPMDFSTLELDRVSVDVPDSEIDQALTRMAERNKKSEPIAAARPAAKGDVVVIDFVGHVDGKEFPGGSASDYHLELGSGSFIPGFEEQVEGATIGAPAQVAVTFPADYGNAQLAGKEARFDVTLKEIREPKPSALDDGLAQAMGVENLEALRKAVREQIERDYKALARGRMKRTLLDRLFESHRIDLPEGMVEAEFDSIWRQIEEDRKAGRLDPEDAGKTDDALKAEYRDIAKRRVTLGLVLSETGRRNNIQVSAEELNRAIMEEARRYPGRERQVFDFYQKNQGALASLRAPIYEDKVVDFIVELAKVTERHLSPNELDSELKAEAGEATTGKADTAKPEKKAAAKKPAAKKSTKKAKSGAKDEA